MAGCSQFTTTKSPITDKVVVPEISATTAVILDADQEVSATATSYDNIDAQTMFEIMVAEMLVQKSREAEAHSLIMPLAHKTQDIGLSERAFELSLYTNDPVRIREAAELLKALSPDDPVSWKASYLLSVVAGNVSQAVEEWQTYLKISQGQFETIFLTTTNRISRSVSQKNGLAFLQEIKRLYPNERSVDYGIGTAALGYQNYLLAKQHLIAALPYYQNDQDSSIYRDINIKLINSFIGLGLFIDGIEFLAGYMQENPEDIVFQEHYARLEVKAGQLAAAEKRYASILKISPHHYSAQLSLALLQLERQNYSEAEENLSGLLEHPHYRNFAAYYLGLSKKEQNQQQAAVRYFKRVIKGPLFIDAQLQMVAINHSRVGLEATIQSLKGLEPKRKEARVKVLRAKAIFYHSENYIQKAIENYDKALKIDSENIDLLFAQSILFYESNRYDEYEAVLKRVLTIDPQQVDALNALGYFYVEQGKFLEKAEDLISKALAIAPNSFYVLDSKGWLRFAQKRYAEAKVFLIKALEIELDKEVLIHLIKTKWMLKEYEEAKELWHKYQDTYLKNTVFQDLIEGLKYR